LDNDLYRTHLEVAREWGNVWYAILNFIHDSINQETEKKYKTLEEKINKIVHVQTKKKKHRNQDRILHQSN